jgi:hypothetical protein
MVDKRMRDSPIKTFGHMSYVMSYNARTDMVCFIGWIATRSLLTELPADLYSQDDNPKRLRAESLALSRMESYLNGDPYPTLLSMGKTEEAMKHKTDIWSDENTQFLRSLLHEPEANL